VKVWHHSPAHLFIPNMTYMVTAGTYRKENHFKGYDRLSILLNSLFEEAELFGMKLQAWSIFSSHYHFIAYVQGNASSLKRMIQSLHSKTARKVNIIDGKKGRRVWFQYWDTCLTYEKSYYARLQYVHNNPVHHGLAESAELYPFCSASWFEKNAEHSFKKKVKSFKWDKVKVKDEF